MEVASTLIQIDTSYAREHLSATTISQAEQDALKAVQISGMEKPAS